MEWCPVCQANANVICMQIGPLAILYTCEHCRTTLRMSDADTGKAIGVSLEEELRQQTTKRKERHERRGKG